MHSHALCAGKYFTLEEAEALLPQVTRIVQKLRAFHRALDIVQGIEVEISEEFPEDFPDVTAFYKDYHKLSYQFYCTLEKLEILGCVLKDLEEGLVDFPHRFEGREVFLCWKRGEKNVNHWHEVEEGFEHRQRILR